MTRKRTIIIAVIGAAGVARIGVAACFICLWSIFALPNWRVRTRIIQRFCRVAGK